MDASLIKNMKSYDDLVCQRKISDFNRFKRDLLIKDDCFYKNNDNKNRFIIRDEDDIQSFIEGLNKKFYIKDYEKLNKIGRGRTCVVYKAKIDDKICAVKSIAIQSLTNDEKHDVANELRILKMINQNKENYPHVVQMIGINNNENLNIFIELGECSLHDYILGIKDGKNRNFNISEIYKISKQIIEGISSLHNNRIIHRDIKSHNILLTDEKDILLADFGSCKILKNNKEKSKKYVGTKKWMAPEIHMRKYYDKSVDIWSYGATLIEILTLNIPYHDISPLDVSDHIKMGNLPKLKYDLAQNNLSENQKRFFEGLIFSCLQFDPNKRPSANDINDYLKKNKEKLLNNERIEKFLFSK